FVNSPLWIVYNIFVGSWAGIIDEIVTEASIILSIFRYGWRNLEQEKEEGTKKREECYEVKKYLNCSE
ncbi:MAG: YgjV family protein, partial [Lachnospiraceae bacterium]|nr:YgjV family protein [Lachnospiraceae bacterium]